MSFLKTYQKSVASFVTVCFVTSFFILPPPALAQPTLEQIPLSLVPLGIPPELASIDEVFIPDPKKESGIPLIHIQSVHAHAQTQKKIYGLLKLLDEKYGINALYIEGAGEKLNPDYFRFFDDNRLNVRVAEKLVEKGELTGAELFLIESQKKIPAYGLEDPALYRENLTSFEKVMTRRDLTGQFTQETHALLDRLETLLLSPPARKLLRSSEAFDAGQMELLSYALELERMTKEILELDLRYYENQLDWPQMIRLLRLQELESKLEPEKIQSDRQKLIGFLKQIQISPELVQSFENLSFSPFQSGMVYDPGFRKNDLPRYLAERLVEATMERGFSFDRYPYFTRYLEAAILQSELEAERLFGEMEKLFETLIQRVSSRQEEWKLVGLVHEERLLERLFDLELTPKDYAKVEESNQADRPLVRFLLGIESLHEGTNLGDRKVIPDNIEAIESVYGDALRFYSLAKEREEVMVEKILNPSLRASQSEAKQSQDPEIASSLPTEGTVKGILISPDARGVRASSPSAPRNDNEHGVTILITGGFHTEGLSRQFRKKGIPYTIVSPRITEKVSPEVYISALLGETKTAFDTQYLEVAANSEHSDLLLGMFPKHQSVAMEWRRTTKIVPRVIEVGYEERMPLGGFLYQMGDSLFFQDRQLVAKSEARHVEISSRKNGRSMRFPIATLVTETDVLLPSIILEKTRPRSKPSAGMQERKVSGESGGGVSSTAQINRPREPLRQSGMRQLTRQSSFIPPSSWGDRSTSPNQIISQGEGKIPIETSEGGRQKTRRQAELRRGPLKSPEPPSRSRPVDWSRTLVSAAPFGLMNLSDRLSNVNKNLIKDKSHRAAPALSEAKRSRPSTYAQDDAEQESKHRRTEVRFRIRPIHALDLLSLATYAMLIADLFLGFSRETSILIPMLIAAPLAMGWLIWRILKYWKWRLNEMRKIDQEGGPSDEIEALQEVEEAPPAEAQVTPPSEETAESTDIGEAVKKLNPDKIEDYRTLRAIAWTLAHFVRENPLKQIPLHQMPVDLQQEVQTNFAVIQGFSRQNLNRPTRLGGLATALMGAWEDKQLKEWLVSLFSKDPKGKIRNPQLIDLIMKEPFLELDKEKKILKTSPRYVEAIKAELDELVGQLEDRTNQILLALISSAGFKSVKEVTDLDEKTREGLEEEWRALTKEILKSDLLSVVSLGYPDLLREKLKTHPSVPNLVTEEDILDLEIKAGRSTEEEAVTIPQTPWGAPLQITGDLGVQYGQLVFSDPRVLSHLDALGKKLGGPLQEVEYFSHETARGWGDHTVNFTTFSENKERVVLFSDPEKFAESSDTSLEDRISSVAHAIAVALGIVTNREFLTAMDEAAKTQAEFTLEPAGGHPVAGFAKELAHLIFEIQMNQFTVERGDLEAAAWAARHWIDKLASQNIDMAQQVIYLEVQREPETARQLGLFLALIRAFLLIPFEKEKKLQQELRERLEEVEGSRDNMRHFDALLEPSSLQNEDQKKAALKINEFINRHIRQIQPATLDDLTSLFQNISDYIRYVPRAEVRAGSQESLLTMPYIQEFLRLVSTNDAESLIKLFHKDLEGDTVESLKVESRARRRAAYALESLYLMRVKMEEPGVDEIRLGLLRGKEKTEEELPLTVKKLGLETALNPVYPAIRKILGEEFIQERNLEKFFPRAEARLPDGQVRGGTWKTRVTAWASTLIAGVLGWGEMAGESSRSLAQAPAQKRQVEQKVFSPYLGSLYLLQRPPKEGFDEKSWRRIRNQITASRLASIQREEVPARERAELAKGLGKGLETSIRVVWSKMPEFMGRIQKEKGKGAAQDQSIEMLEGELAVQGQIAEGLLGLAKTGGPDAIRFASAAFRKTIPYARENVKNFRKYQYPSIADFDPDFSYRNRVYQLMDPFLEDLHRKHGQILALLEKEIARQEQYVKGERAEEKRVYKLIQGLRENKSPIQQEADSLDRIIRDLEKGNEGRRTKIDGLLRDPEKKDVKVQELRGQIKTHQAKIDRNFKEKQALSRRLQGFDLQINAALKAAEAAAKSRDRYEETFYFLRLELKWSRRAEVRSVDLGLSPQLPKKSLGDPRTNKGEVTHPSPRGDSLEADDLGLGEPHGNQPSPGLGELQPVRFKFGEEPGGIMSRPEPGLFLKGLELGYLGMFSFGHGLSSPRIKPFLGVRHIPGRDRANDAAAQVAGHHQQMPAIVGLSIDQVKPSFPQNEGPVITRFLYLFGMNPMPSYVINVLLSPVKMRNLSQGLSPKGLYVYIRKMSNPGREYVSNPRAEVRALTTYKVYKRLIGQFFKNDFPGLMKERYQAKNNSILEISREFVRENRRYRESLGGSRLMELVYLTFFPVFLDVRLIAFHYISGRIDVLLEKDPKIKDIREIGKTILQGLEDPDSIVPFDVVISYFPERKSWTTEEADAMRSKLKRLLELEAGKIQEALHGNKMESYIERIRGLNLFFTLFRDRFKFFSEKDDVVFYRALKDAEDSLFPRRAEVRSGPKKKRLELEQLEDRTTPANPFSLVDPNPLYLAMMDSFDSNQKGGEEIPAQLFSNFQTPQGSVPIPSENPVFSEIILKPASGDTKDWKVDYFWDENDPVQLQKRTEVALKIIEPFVQATGGTVQEISFWFEVNRQYPGIGPAGFFKLRLPDDSIRYVRFHTEDFFAQGVYQEGGFHDSIGDAKLTKKIHVFRILQPYDQGGPHLFTNPAALKIEYEIQNGIATPKAITRVTGTESIGLYNTVYVRRIPEPTTQRFDLTSLSAEERDNLWSRRVDEMLHMPFLFLDKYGTELINRGLRNYEGVNLGTTQVLIDEIPPVITREPLNRAIVEKTVTVNGVPHPIRITVEKHLKLYGGHAFAWHLRFEDPVTQREASVIYFESVNFRPLRENNSIFLISPNGDLQDVQPLFYEKQAEKLSTLMGELVGLREPAASSEDIFNYFAGTYSQMRTFAESLFPSGEIQIEALSSRHFRPVFSVTDNLGKDVPINYVLTLPAVIQAVPAQLAIVLDSSGKFLRFRMASLKNEIQEIGIQEQNGLWFLYGKYQGLFEVNRLLGTFSPQALQDQVRDMWGRIQRRERFFDLTYDLIAHAGPGGILTLVAQSWEMPKDYFLVIKQVLDEAFKSLDLDPTLLARWTEHAKDKVLRMIVTGFDRIGFGGLLPELEGDIAGPNTLGFVYTPYADDRLGVGAIKWVWTNPFLSVHAAIHELTHMAHFIGIPENRYEEIERAAFDSVITRRLWRGTYAGQTLFDFSNWREIPFVEEWFAEVVTFFKDGGTPFHDPVYNHARLWDYDNPTARFLTSLFGYSFTDPAHPTLDPDLPHAEAMERLLQFSLKDGDENPLNDVILKMGGAVKSGTNLNGTFTLTVPGYSASNWSYASRIIRDPNYEKRGSKFDWIYYAFRNPFDWNDGQGYQQPGSGSEIKLAGSELVLTNEKTTIRIFQGFVNESNQLYWRWEITGDKNVNIFKIPTEALRTMTLGEMIRQASLLSLEPQPSPQPEQPKEPTQSTQPKPTLSPHYPEEVQTILILDFPEERKTVIRLEPAGQASFQFQPTSPSQEAPVSSPPVQSVKFSISGGAGGSDSAHSGLMIRNPSEIMALWRKLIPRLTNGTPLHLRRTVTRTAEGNYRIRFRAQGNEIHFVVDPSGRLIGINGEDVSGLNLSEQIERFREQVIQFLNRMGVKVSIEKGGLQSLRDQLLASFALMAGSMKEPRRQKKRGPIPGSRAEVRTSASSPGPQNEAVSSLLNQLPIEPNLPVMKAAVQQTLDWLLQEGLLQTSIFEVYRDALEEAEESDQVPTIGKGPFHREGVKISINSRGLSQEIAILKAVGSADYFAVNFLLTILREAQSYSFSRWIRTTRWGAEFEKEAAPLLIDGFKSAKTGQWEFNWPSNDLSRFFSQYGDKIADFLAYLISIEHFGGLKQIEGLEEFAKRGLYDPKRLQRMLNQKKRSRDRRQKQLVPYLKASSQQVKETLSNKEKQLASLQTRLRSSSVFYLSRWLEDIQKSLRDLTTVTYFFYFFSQFELFSKQGGQKGIRREVFDVIRQRLNQTIGEKDLSTTWFHSAASDLLPKVQTIIDEYHSRAEVRNFEWIPPSDYPLGYNFPFDLGELIEHWKKWRQMGGEIEGLKHEMVTDKGLLLEFEPSNEYTNESLELKQIAPGPSPREADLQVIILKKKRIGNSERELKATFNLLSWDFPGTLQIEFMAEIKEDRQALPPFRGESILKGAPKEFYRKIQVSKEGILQFILKVQQDGGPIFVGYSLDKPFQERTANDWLEEMGFSIEDRIQFSVQRAEVRLVQKVLLVEDDDLIGKMAKMLLEARRYQVDWVMRGDEGLKKFQESTQQGQQVYDTVITDTDLPGMSGFALAEEIEKLSPGPKTYIVMMSGHPRQGHTDLQNRGTISGFLKKPFYPKDFDAMVDQIAQLPRAEVRLPAARLPDASLPDWQGQGKAGSLLPGRALLPKLRAETRFERGGVRVESGSFGPVSEFEHGLAVPTVGTPNLPVIAPVVLPGLVGFFQDRDPRTAARVAVDLFRSADKPNPLMDVLLTEDPVLASAFLEVLKEMIDQGITQEDQIYALVERVFSEKLREGALLRKSLETPAAHTVVLDHAPDEEEFLGILFPAILNRSLFIEILFTPGSGVDKQKMRELVKEARKLIRDSRRRLVVIHPSSQDWGLFRATLSQTGQRLHSRMAGVSGVPQDSKDFVQRFLAVSLSEPLWGLSSAGELPFRAIVYKFTRGSEGYATKFGAVSILASKLGVLSEPQKRNYFAVQGRRYEVKEDALGEFVASIQTAFSGIHKILASA